MLDRLPRELQECVVNKLDPTSRRALRGVSAAMRDLATAEADLLLSGVVYDMTFVTMHSDASPQRIAISPRPLYDAAALAEFMKDALEAVRGTPLPTAECPSHAAVKLGVSTSAIRRAAGLTIRAMFVGSGSFVQQGQRFHVPSRLVLSLRYVKSWRHIDVGIEYPERAWVSFAGRHRDAATPALAGMMLHAWSRVVGTRQHHCTLWLSEKDAVGDEVPAMLRALFATLDIRVAP